MTYMNGVNQQVYCNGALLCFLSGTDSIFKMSFVLERINTGNWKQRSLCTFGTEDCAGLTAEERVKGKVEHVCFKFVYWYFEYSNGRDIYLLRLQTQCSKANYTRNINTLALFSSISLNIHNIRNIK